MYNYNGQLLARIIKEQREKLNLTQEKISALTGISIFKIIQYEF